MTLKILLATGVVAGLCLLTSFTKKTVADEKDLYGAWQRTEGDTDEILVFMDDYFTHTTFSKAKKQFIQTRGGTYTEENKKLTVIMEFDTKNKEAVGQSFSYPISFIKGAMVTTVNDKTGTWQRVDNGREGLSGLWKITARNQDGKLVPIHQAGTRKTIKILTNKRFQWAAIDPGTKSFMGTGGGSYTFRDGKYTENIEFFSRDSSRVGSSLSFEGKLQNGDWHHSGLSSKGDPIYEVWSRKK